MTTYYNASEVSPIEAALAKMYVPCCLRIQDGSNRGLSSLPLVACLHNRPRRNPSSPRNKQPETLCKTINL